MHLKMSSANMAAILSQPHWGDHSHYVPLWAWWIDFQHKYFFLSMPSSQLSKISNTVFVADKPLFTASGWRMSRDSTTSWVKLLQIASGSVFRRIVQTILNIASVMVHARSKSFADKWWSSHMYLSCRQCQSCSTVIHILPSSRFVRWYQ